MYRFFVTHEQLEQTPVSLTGEDYHHIKNVLHLKAGDIITLCDGKGREYECSITGFDKEPERVLVKVTDIVDATRELPVKITLFQGYPKGDKLETVVQKAVELGAFEVVPVMMKRCVVRLDEKKALKKVERLNAVSLSAAKQAKRDVIPKVREVMSFSQAVAYAGTMETILLPYENAEGMEHARQVIAGTRGKKRIGIFIGPEGGFESSEIQQLEEVGAQTFSLGHRILRTKTAGMTVLSLLMFLLEKDD